MVFSSTLFIFGFLPIFLLCHFMAFRFGPFARNLNLLIFSLAFYFLGSGFYVLLLIGVTIFNWACGLVVANNKNRLLLGVAVTANIAPLLFFKYADFGRQAASDIVTGPLFGIQLGPLGVILPIGISFYTFQGVSYIVDVWRGVCSPAQSLIAFSAYKTAFPQLIAGPIVRYDEVKGDMRTLAIGRDDWNKAITLFCVGLSFKMLLADPLARPVDQIYGLAPNEVSTFMAWFAAICYALQILFDFSGYSLMAIGMGLMLGLHFPSNFDQPYRAQNITAFWRRWHMSLSRWFRDYLYIPLGGNRAGTGRTLFNLWLTFLLCGLWHGAAWTFVAWGAYHGLLLVIERLLKRRFGFETKGAPGVALTLVLVTAGWVLFRSPSLDTAFVMLRKMTFLDSAGVSQFGLAYYLTPQTFTLLAIGGALALAPFDKMGLREKITGARGGLIALASLVLLALSVGEIAANGFNPFIYFRF